MKEIIVEKLLYFKMNNPEIGEGKRFDRVNEYIDRSITDIEEKIKSLPTKHSNGWEELNKMFLSFVN